MCGTGQGVCVCREGDQKMKNTQLGGNMEEVQQLTYVLTSLIRPFGGVRVPLGKPNWAGLDPVKYFRGETQ